MAKGTNADKEGMNTLVELARAGDAVALGDLIESIQDPVYGIVFRMLGHRDDAHDATQEILIKVVTTLGSFRGESQFMTWVYRIATNHVLSSLREKKPDAISFDAMAAQLEQGLAYSAQLTTHGADEPLFAEEIMRQCTQRMLLSLDVPIRLAYIIGDVCDMNSDDGRRF